MSVIFNVANLKRVTTQDIEAKTLKQGATRKESEYKPLFDALKDLPKGEGFALPVPEQRDEQGNVKDARRVARTMQQNILGASKRCNFPVTVKISADNTEVFVTAKEAAVSAPATPGALVVRYKNAGGKIGILNLDAIKAADEELHEALAGYEGKVWGPNKGKLEAFLDGKSIAKELVTE